MFVWGTVPSSWLAPGGSATGVLPPSPTVHLDKPTPAFDGQPWAHVELRCVNAVATAAATAATSEGAVAPARSGRKDWSVLLVSDRRRMALVSPGYASFRRCDCVTVCHDFGTVT